MKAVAPQIHRTGALAALGRLHHRATSKAANASPLGHPQSLLRSFSICARVPFAKCNVARSCVDSDLSNPKGARIQAQFSSLFFGRGVFKTTSTPMQQYVDSKGPQAVASQAPRYKALTVDIGGTFLKTAVPVAEAYASIGKKYGVTASPEDIKRGFKAAFAKPWPERLRYEGDGRPFWRHAVATATGSSDPDYFEELYLHYSRGDAWEVEDGAAEALSKLKAEGVKLAVVSNFDTRLRPVLDDLGVANLFDAIIVSAEVGYEKPSVEIFQAALSALKIGTPSDAAHIGDDRAADVEGANAAGMRAWLWKEDVKTFDELVKLVL